MNNSINLKFWELRLEVNGSANLILSNSAILNIICSSFICCDDLVIVKMVALDDVKISLLTGSFYAEKLFLTKYSNNEILNELQAVNYFFDVQITQLELCSTGFVLGVSDQDFLTIKSEAELFLSQLDSNYTARSKLLLTTSPFFLNSEQLIKEDLSSSDVSDLLRNSLQISSEEINQTSSIPTSSKSMKDSESEYRDYLNSHQSSSHLSRNEKPVLTNSQESDDTLQEIKLRDYQEELAQPAVRGKNCIIFAPTGSGKTVVAAYICKKFVKTNPSGRILFLVPRVPLVTQQHDLLKRYLNSVNQICGDMTSRVPPSSLIKSHSVSVMTAAIFLNLLKDDQLSFDDIGILIFDECHHTMKKHVYNKIMICYMNERFSNKSTVADLPQIIGLSASPGVGKAKSDLNAETNIKTLMANLDVTIAPVQVLRHVESLKRFLNTNADEIVGVDRCPDDEFANAIKNAMSEVEIVLLNTKAEFAHVIDDDPIFDSTRKQGTKDYEAWVVSVLDFIKHIKNKQASLCLESIVTHLKEYNNSLMMNDHVSNSYVKEYLDRVLFLYPNDNEVNIRLQRIYNKYDPQPSFLTNPLLEKLHSILTSHYSANPNTRCIVFVKERMIANALVTYLNDRSNLALFGLNPKQITGTRVNSERLGMTKAGQDDVLEAFRNGNCKLLVSTSVAEEGLDIEACNLIITYNYSTNEIGKIQRKGRGRAEDSRFVILAYNDSGNIERERNNDMKKDLAEAAMDKIRNTDPYVLKSEILKMQFDAKNKRDSEEAILQQSPSRTKDTSPYTLLCSSCKTKLTTSDRIRHINKQHHVVVDTDFLNNVEILYFHHENKLCPDVIVNGKILCKNPKCRRRLGPCMIHKKVRVYVLQISAVVLELPGCASLSSAKKWSAVPFYDLVPPLDARDPQFTRMISGLTDREYDDDDDDDIYDFDFDSF